ncbi:MAG: ATP-binding protein [Anaeromyxobacter sp.]
MGRRGIALAFESGANGQFVLHGNVHDRLAVGGRLQNLPRYLEEELLSGFDVIFAYDLGNGLRVSRGAEAVAAWRGDDAAQPFPRDPRAAVELVARYVRTLGNLRALGRKAGGQVALVLRDADQVLPKDGAGPEQGGLVSLVRDFAGEAPFAELPFASLLIADSLSDLHPLVSLNPRVARIKVPLPGEGELAAAVGILQAAHPAAFEAGTAAAQAAGAFAGVSVSALESLVRRRAHEARPLSAADQVSVKKELIEREASGLVELIESRRTLADYHGQEALKTWLRQDVALWKAGDLRALPMGYLVCGPVGTGKTFLVECLAGEAGVPVVKLKNFRDRWVGSSEGNLEKIFRLVRALGRCVVFVDEADQALGRRESGSSDGGLSGRLYGMVAQEMSDGGNRGRVMWVLASSRPDLIEVDLKRPGRVDVKVPILPTTTPAESAGLLAALCRRQGLDVPAAEIEPLRPPTLLTPGAAEAVAVKAYRIHRTGGLAPAAALARCLEGYQGPVPLDVLEHQMRLAIREATDLAFVPEALRHLAAGDLP